MRTISGFDQAAPSFTLASNGYKSTGDHDGSMRNEGSLAFTIESRVMAEIGHNDLLESWAAAAELSLAETVKLTEVAASHLSGILECGLSSSDLTEAITDAAVVFLLALKQHGISDPKRIPACAVMWNGRTAEGHVVFGA